MVSFRMCGLEFKKKGLQLHSELQYYAKCVLQSIGHVQIQFLLNVKSSQTFHHLEYT